MIAAASFIVFGSVVSAPAATDAELHDQAAQSLVKLTVVGKRGIAGNGANVGDDVTSIGTGFLIGDDGYILTTAHIFDAQKVALAVDTTIKANVFGLGDVDALFISEHSSLDLVLLRAFKPRGTNWPASLEIGHGDDVDPADRGLLTSGGWDDDIPLREPLIFISETTKLVPYAWSVRAVSDLKLGHSGSPVYIERNGEPLVVGVLKATAKGDSNLGLMIPIENSFQLIGQLKIQEMEGQISNLFNRFGLAELPAHVDRWEASEGARDLEISVEQGVCFLTQVKGNFDHTSDMVGLTVVDGTYHLVGEDRNDSYVTAKPVCLLFQ